MNLVNLVLIIYACLFFPLIINVRAIVDINTKKCYYSIRLFKFIKLNMGYITIDDKFLYVHYSKKRAIAIDYKKAKPNKTLISEIKAVDILKLKSKIIVQTDDLPNTYGIMAVLNVLYNNIAKIISTYKPYLKLNNQSIIIEDKKNLSLLFDIKFVFCIQSIIAKAISSILKNLIKGENNAKKQAKAN